MMDDVKKAEEKMKLMVSLQMDTRKLAKDEVEKAKQAHAKKMQDDLERARQRQASVNIWNMKDRNTDRQTDIEIMKM